MSVKVSGSLDQALNRLVSLKQQHVKVGVMDGSKYEDGTSVATVAFKNEYGYKNIPPRPFFRTTIKEQKENWSVITIKAIKAGYSIDKTLALVGMQMQQDVQYSIMTWSVPPNAPYTVAIKGYNSPLRHTLLMHDSITYEVSDGNL
ncbi:hypothetical protein [Chryseobacterium sp.]|uniref:hypothetical protein n=1 Tax=Chryseobacterium sp. TaxID=1871047 RepID=UPI003218F0F2